MRTEPKLAPGALRWPAATAIAFIAALTASIWWESRDDGPAPAVSAAAPPARTVPKAAPKAVAALPQAVALSDFAGKDLPEEWPGTRASTVEGLRLLAAAIAAHGDSSLWGDRAKRLGEAADQVEAAADPQQAAALAQDALVQAAEWIGGLPQARANPGPSDALRTAAQSIKEDQPLREQAGSLENYFDAAARALDGTAT